MNATHEIETLIDTYRQAVIAKDVEKIMALYGDDIVSYDAVKALQFRGKTAYRKHWLECMEMCQGAHKFDFDQMNVVADEHIAFAHWLAHCGGTNDKGETQSCWMRVTACYRQVGGAWKIAHEHWSAPFDPMSGATLFDVTP